MGRRILVTGGAGYVGSIVVNELLGRGYSVRAFDALRYGSVPSLLLPWGNPEFEFVRGDIRDSDARKHAVEDVEAIVHLAAIVGDPACASDPELARSISNRPKRCSTTPSWSASSGSSWPRPAATTDT